MRSILKWCLITGGIIIGGLVIFAFARTWNKTEIECLVHINERLVLQSVYGESPTFAIWLEDPDNGQTYTAYATRRIATGDWEGKADVPVALPMWSEIFKAEKNNRSGDAGEAGDELISTGATPLPGYFRTRVRVKPGSSWICWIEYNLSGDYNETYPQYNPETHAEDEWGTGQPALLLKAEIAAIKGRVVVPEISGMCVLDQEGKVLVEPLHGITTATEVLDEISISVVKPKPRIINKPILNLQERHIWLDSRYNHSQNSSIL
jgi:hypothetical protein